VSGKRLLLVEDELSVRQCLSEYLADVGFEVEEAADGDQAIAIMNLRDVDLLITDIDIPGRLDGNGIAIKAKERFPGLPVVYASGYRDGLRNAIGPYDKFLGKPYGPAEVTVTIERILAALSKGEPDHDRHN
jgi:DNA-binding NtrC family response regulator